MAGGSNPVRAILYAWLDEACRRIHEAEVRLRERILELGWLFMEPDLED